MSYTWEQVLLNMDVRDEAERERKQQRDIQEKQLEEDKAAGMWSLGLSLVGGAIFGPAGYMAGKMIGRHGADLGWFGGDYSDWETAEVSTGKFDKEATEEFKRTRKKAADDQTQGQILNAVTDLAAM